MRLTSFAILALLGFLCAPLAGQCVLPYTEDFETASGTTPPAGWSLDPASDQPWTADSGGTTSSLTGPSIDHNPGTSTGIYLYLETSTGAVGDQAILNSPVYDVSALTSPCVNFWYHMYGETMGTLALEVWDGSAWFPAWSMSGNLGDVWRVANVPLPVYADAGCSFPIASKFRLVGTRGTSFTGDMAIDDISIVECPPLEWETNDSVSSLDIDGVLADPFLGAAIVNKTTYLCPGGVDPVTSIFTISSNLAGNVFDIVVSGAPLVGATGGGVTLPDGQIVNLDLLQPFTPVSGGPGLLLPGSAISGASNVSISIATSINAATTLSAQALVFDPAAPLGFSLSQGVELNVVLLPPPTSIPGPTTTTSGVSVDVTSAPTCWCSGGIPFFGSTFSTMHVSANGYVNFGGSDFVDTTPSISDAINDFGRVGFWTDLDPSEGGTITIGNPATDIIRVDWAGVFYNTGGPGISFGIEFDCATGVIQIDGLGGLVANPGTATTDDQWLGISPGITFAPTVTTDPGAAPFGLGANGFAAAATDMLYEFNDTSVTLMGLPASVLGGMTALVFTPDGMGNYSWAGM